MITAPPGFALGHWTDRERWTGCTVILSNGPSVAAGEVVGGAAGTRECALLSPAAAVNGVQGVLISGGSAYGLAAADGVMAWLAEEGLGHRTPSGALVPLVPAAVVFDLGVGEPAAPGPAQGRAACEAAVRAIDRGRVGAGTGCTVGKVLGPQAAMPGGLGAAIERAGEATLCAVAVVNAVGDVLAEDGTVLAGPRIDGAIRPTAELLRRGLMRDDRGFGREATVIVCLMTDAVLTKTQAWTLARVSAAGVARAVDPCWTAHDGDVIVTLASGRVEADPLVLGALGAHAVAGAIRDAVRSAR